MHRSSFVPAVLLAVGCTATPVAQVDPPDGGSSDGGATWQITHREHLGGFVGSPPRAVLPGVTRSSLLVAHAGFPVEDPATYGLEPNEHGFAIPTGLLEVDTATGTSRLFTHADGLPSYDYPGAGGTAGRAAVPLFDLAWIETDERFAAAGWTHLVRGTRTETGWSFTSRTLRAPSFEVNATVLNVAVAGDELFVGTDQGLVALASDTLEPRRWLTLDARTATVGQLSAGGLDGAAVAVLYGEADATLLSRVALVRPGTDVVEELELPTGHRPTAVHVHAGALYIGTRGPAGLGAVFVAMPGEQLRTLATGEDFAFAEVGVKPFIPNRFAVDEVHGLLVVGGSISSNAPGTSGGLVEFRLTAPGSVELPGRLTFERRERTAELLPWQVDTLTIDALGRWYVAGRQLCSESRAFTNGVWRIESDGRERRLVAPWVSGVRDIHRDRVDGQTWLVLADEAAALACDGLALRRTVCRLKADGSCEAWAPFVNFDDDFFSADGTASSLAFGDPARRELALVGRSEIGFIRTNETTRALLTTLEPGLSLQPTRAAWGAPGALWIGSEVRWSPPIPGTGEQDAEVLNARRGHGLGYIEFGSEAQPTFSRRYVHRPSDLRDSDVGGLPSSAILDVLPLEGERHALVATGIERISRPSIHVRGLLAPNERQGGIAEVQDTDVHVVAPPEGVTFGDVVALVRAPDGTLLALDAEHGVFAIDLTTHTATLRVAAPWRSGARGASLAANENGVIAIGATDGVHVSRADKTIESLHGVGLVSSVRFVGEQLLYVGADRGLLRLAFDGALLPAPGPTGILERELWPLPRGCDGARGCSCRIDNQCEDGLDCLCERPSQCVCGGADPCSQMPFADGCACKSKEDCANGLTCICEGEACSCGVPDCGGVAGCACEGPQDCTDGHLCGDGGTCEVDEACEIGCACPTESGCLGAKVCEDGFAGKRCR